MSFKRKLVSAATSALAVVAFTTFVSAQDTNTNKENDSMQRQEMRERGRGGKRGGKRMRGGKHGGGDKHLMRSLERLNLSDAQKTQVRTISENFKTSTQTQREELRNLGMKKRDGIITADEQARFKEIKMQLKTSGEQMRISVLAVLTAEQKTQLEQMKEAMKKRKEEHQNRRNQAIPQSEIN